MRQQKRALFLHQRNRSCEKETGLFSQLKMEYSRLLKPHNVPMIEDETEVGHHVGAVVDVTDRDGAVEFGDRLKAFKAFRLNKWVPVKSNARCSQMWLKRPANAHFSGGIAEWDRQGAGVDVGSRASAADDLVKLRWTLFGVNVGPNASRTLVGPGPGTLGRAKGAGKC